MVWVSWFGLAVLVWSGCTGLDWMPWSGLGALVRTVCPGLDLVSWSPESLMENSVGMVFLERNNLILPSLAEVAPAATWLAAAR